MNREYIKEQWEEEMRLDKFCGQHNNLFYNGCNLECPSCHEIGFYGPREIKSEGRKYRACKWCGFWQEAAGPVFNDRGGNPYRGTIRSHSNCGKEKTWGTAGADKWCSDCGCDVIEEGVHKDDPTFKSIKEEMDGFHQNIQRITI